MESPQHLNSKLRELRTLASNLRECARSIRREAIGHQPTPPAPTEIGKLGPDPSIHQQIDEITDVVRQALDASVDALNSLGDRSCENQAASNDNRAAGATRAYA